MSSPTENDDEYPECPPEAKAFQEYLALRRKHIYARGQFDPPLSSIGYRSQYVAWVDILGWSEVMTGPEASKLDTLQRISRTLGLISRLPQRVQEEKELAVVDPSYLRQSNIDVSIFSDTVVIFAPDTVHCLLELFLKVSELWHQLLQDRFSCRGAIVHGGVFYNGFQAVGPAIAEAARIEKHVAIYPRIVISESVKTQLKRPLVFGDVIEMPREPVAPTHANPSTELSRLIAATLHSNKIKEISKYIRADPGDGVQFLDVLALEPLMSVPSTLRQFIAAQVSADIAQVIEQLRDQPERRASLTKILAKKMWVKDYLEAHISETSKSEPA